MALLHLLVAPGFSLLEDHEEKHGEQPGSVQVQVLFTVDDEAWC